LSIGAGTVTFSRCVLNSGVYTTAWKDFKNKIPLLTSLPLIHSPHFKDPSSTKYTALPLPGELTTTAASFCSCVKSIFE